MTLNVARDEYEASFRSVDEIDLQEFIVIHCKLIPAEGFSLEEAAVGILLTTTLMNLKPLGYENMSARSKDRGYVLSAKDPDNVVLALPLALCSENEGLTQLYVLMTFGVEYQYAEEFWVDDIELPEKFIKRFHGPRFGIEGIRKLFQLPSRPPIGAILGPRSGISLDQIQKIAYECLIGGADFIADDLRLIDPDNELAFSKRVPSLAKIAERASIETGEKKLYVANISMSPFRSIRMLDLAKNEGVGGVIVNTFTMGFASVEEIVNQANVPVITAGMGESFLAREQQPLGVSGSVLFKLARLAGVDAIHTGTSSSECYGPEAWGQSTVAIRSGFDNLLPGCFAVAEGGVTLADVWDNIYSLGPDVIIKACAGIIDFPGGPRNGAYAFRVLAENLNFLMNQREAHDKIMEIASKDPIVKTGLEIYDYKPKLLL